MKIVLIAGFSNPEIREHLQFKKDRKVFHQLIKLFGLPARVGENTDHAPWIPGIIAVVEKHPEMELHVIGPQIRLKHSVEEFKLRGVTYHFFKTEYTSLLRKLNNYKLWKRLQLSGYYTKRLLRKINPDLVVLSGAENPATSVSILSGNDFPRLCLCQTIYNNPKRSLYSVPNKLIQDMEKDIFSQVQHFGVYCKMHYDLLHEMNPRASIFKFGYPTKGTLLEPTPTQKEYDFVNFALQMDLRKGYHDSIKALAIVKKKYPNVKLNLLGRASDEQKAQLVELIDDLNLQDNITFTPFFEKRSDMFLHIQKSKFAVLPCKLDHTSGTMSQAMQLELPLVVYKTTGTPAFNRKKECVLIAELENVEQLAQHMLTLMDDPERACQLAKNAREFQEEKVEIARHNGERLMETFKSVLDNYRNGKPIPNELLFDPERDD